MGGGLFLGHSLIIIKWTWRVFFPKICNLNPPPSPLQLGTKEYEESYIHPNSAVSIQRTLYANTRFFQKQHFYKQRQSEIGKKIKQMLSNTLRLNFCYLKIIDIFHLRYHPKIIGYILKNKQKNKCGTVHEIIQLIIMKMKMKMKNKSHRYDINRPRTRHGHKYSKYRKCLILTVLLSNT